MPFGPAVEATGTGNSPPAKKRAESPDNAIKFGSARRRTTPLVSSAVTRLSIDSPLLSLSTLVSNAPYGVAPLASVPIAPTSGRLPAGLAPTGVLPLFRGLTPPMDLRPTNP